MPLVIHVEGFGLVLLGKTCRLCLRCDTLVAHKAELDSLLKTVVNAPKPEMSFWGPSTGRCTGADCRAARRSTM